MDYLKRTKVFIRSLGEELVIRQLSAKAQSEIVVAYKGNDQHQAGFIAIKYGVPQWSDLSLDEISNGLSMAQINEINDAIAALSEIEPKNSESAPTESSSSS